MSAQLLAGGPVAEAVLDDVRRRTAALVAQGVTPGLGTILVGDDGASASYVRKKHETCEQVGIASFHADIPAEAGQQALLDAVERFNADPAVHAYIIQHPVPEGFDFNAALLAMAPEKDADGLHPVNLGRLVLQEDGPVPCTPAGIQAMLLHYGVDIAGKHVVIVGRGPTLGRPLALLLTLKAPGANAAVTVVHSEETGPRPRSPQLRPSGCGGAGSAARVRRWTRRGPGWAASRTRDRRPGDRRAPCRAPHPTGRRS
ncbi:MAG: bifunctional 5,10-methylenetetrahydrofolate dehydrogenase/5,10-methenyltetrahydrofolate cyclohydrolase [Acidimicrobiales bacterium]|nr:bifunctional 5,10-methylenetetrahydrofolate dehydrogenase/5,10-methenyltetrahydrofolate cyclohydrolase [Acidimicrobiales bacterium]